LRSIKKIFSTEDNYHKEDLYPFTLTRSVLDIRVGILTIREKWERLLQKEKIELINDDEDDAMRVPVNFIPSHNFIKAISKKDYKDSEFSFSKIIKYPWDIFNNNEWAINEDFELITKGRKSEKISSTNKIIGSHKNIFLENGAIAEHCILNVTDGPIYIGKKALVMEGCLVRGPFAMCEKSLLKMGTKIYGATTIGPHCVAGGEIKNSIMFDYSNKSHDGYLGNSVIGEWCNLGAGTSNSNLKNTAGEVNVWNELEKNHVSAGIKCGLLMGDYSRCAINTSFNTGTVVGVSCNIFGDGFPPKNINSFSWGNEKYDLEKAFQHIDNWKKLKGVNLTGKEKELLTNIYHQTK
jgi:UDP-N-acetylglucosamine diphosphorylase/glucosamine-1-phosphate N-acetyltransferase